MNKEQLMGSVRAAIVEVSPSAFVEFESIEGDDKHLGVNIFAPPRDKERLRTTVHTLDHVLCRGTGFVLTAIMRRDSHP